MQGGLWQQLASVLFPSQEDRRKAAVEMKRRREGRRRRDTPVKSQVVSAVTTLSGPRNLRCTNLRLFAECVQARRKRWKSPEKHRSLKNRRIMACVVPQTFQNRCFSGLLTAFSACLHALGNRRVIVANQKSGPGNSGKMVSEGQRDFGWRAAAARPLDRTVDLRFPNRVV